MSDFNVDIIQNGKVTVVRTQGYLDDIGGKVFREQCTEFINKGQFYFVFNLEKTPVINSTGLSTLLDIMVQIIDYNEGEVAISGLSKLTQTALQMTGVMTLCDAYPTEAEAVAAIAEAAG
ncbi:MAG: STAS domain-containing protein [Candidatus Riflebacteria bacterium]|nr:STAS domain-containing protein [Candidatus Riflebacteria bacterium]